MSKNGETDKTVIIPDGKANMVGTLVIPEGAKAVVLFAHGSGSSRHSPRNNYVASVIRKNGMATLLLDLLTPAEDSNYETRFDIDLLAHRLFVATKWLQAQPETCTLSIGYFGASTGAAAAIKSAATPSVKIYAIVSRGGRPDLAMPYLDKISSPTLLIVGSKDDVVIELNKEAYERLACIKKLEIVQGATHLFEEQGALERVAELAEDWFVKHLASC